MMKDNCAAPTLVQFCDMIFLRPLQDLFSSHRKVFSNVSIEGHHHGSYTLNLLVFGRLAALLKRGEMRKELDWQLCVLLVSPTSTFTSASCKVT